MLPFFRHFLLTLSVVLLLGHNTIAHAHGCETGGVHTDDIIHQIGDFFGTDLGQGHLAHLDVPQSGETADNIPDLQPVLLSLWFLVVPPAPVLATEIAFCPVSQAASHEQGHGTAWGLRGPPARN